MIRKLLSIILSTTLMLSLAGFAQKEEAKEQEKSESEAVPGFILNFDASLSFDSDSETKKTQFYLMDENGEKIKSLNNDMRRILEENNINPEKVEISFNDYIVGGLMFAEFKTHEVEYKGFYAIDFESRRLKKILPISEYNSIEYVDYYKDKFIVGVIDMSSHLAEYEFTLSEADDLSFKMEKSKYDKVLKYINDNVMTVKNQMPDFSLARVLGYGAEKAPKCTFSAFQYCNEIFDPNKAHPFFSVAT